MKFAITVGMLVAVPVLAVSYFSGAVPGQQDAGDSLSGISVEPTWIVRPEIFNAQHRLTVLTLPLDAEGAFSRN